MEMKILIAGAGISNALKDVERELKHLETVYLAKIEDMKDENGRPFDFWADFEHMFETWFMFGNSAGYIDPVFLVPQKVKEAYDYAEATRKVVSSTKIDIDDLRAQLMEIGKTQYYDDEFRDPKEYRKRIDHLNHSRGHNEKYNAYARNKSGIMRSKMVYNRLL